MILSVLKSLFSSYYLATSAHDASVKLWDLRKLKNFKTLSFDNDAHQARHLFERIVMLNYRFTKVAHVDFDYSGSYLAVGGTDIRSATSSYYSM